jgi:hypothetical protein
MSRGRGGARGGGRGYGRGRGRGRQFRGDDEDDDDDLTWLPGGHSHRVGSGSTKKKRTSAAAAAIVVSPMEVSQSLSAECIVNMRASDQVAETNAESTTTPVGDDKGLKVNRARKRRRRRGSSSEPNAYAKVYKTFASRRRQLEQDEERSLANGQEGDVDHKRHSSQTHEASPINDLVRPSYVHTTNEFIRLKSKEKWNQRISEASRAAANHIVEGDKHGSQPTTIFSESPSLTTAASDERSRTAIEGQPIEDLPEATESCEMPSAEAETNLLSLSSNATCLARRGRRSNAKKLAKKPQRVVAKTVATPGTQLQRTKITSLDVRASNPIRLNSVDSSNSSWNEGPSLSATESTSSSSPTPPSHSSKHTPSVSSRSVSPGLSGRLDSSDDELRTKVIRCADCSQEVVGFANLLRHQDEHKTSLSMTRIAKKRKRSGTRNADDEFSHLPLPPLAQKAPPSDDPVISKSQASFAANDKSRMDDGVAPAKNVLDLPDDASKENYDAVEKAPKKRRVESRRIQCALCPVAVDGQESFDEHVLIKHFPGGAKLCPCDSCGTLFANRHLLRMHELNNCNSSHSGRLSADSTGTAVNTNGLPIIKRQRLGSKKERAQRNRQITLKEIRERIRQTSAASSAAPTVESSQKRSSDQSDDGERPSAAGPTLFDALRKNRRGRKCFKPTAKLPSWRPFSSGNDFEPTAAASQSSSSTTLSKLTSLEASDSSSSSERPKKKKRLLRCFNRTCRARFSEPSRVQTHGTKAHLMFRPRSLIIKRFLYKSR